MDSKTALADNKVKIMDFKSIERRINEYTHEEKVRLEIEPPRHWVDNNPQEFTREQRATTTILIGGLTLSQDKLIEAGFESIGYRVKALDCPTHESLQYGKEYGNRGQCNPVYFTVGNLIRHLVYLRDNAGQSTEQIIRENIFLTAGGCGPCRFGMYITEYRKALRDAGFEGFRVVTFKHDKGINQGPAEAGLALTPRFFITLVSAIVAGDVLNAVGYRMRPYETEKGATDKALKTCRELLATSLRRRKNMLLSLYRCRKILHSVRLNRLQIKPRVSITGEFWAMTTEGEGNYHLQKYLESEGAECMVQPVTDRVLHNLWEAEFNNSRVLTLRKHNKTDHITRDFTPVKHLFLIRLAKVILASSFRAYAWAIGLKNYPVTNFNKMAMFGKNYYTLENQGGEAHLECAHLVEMAKENTAHLMISVKPFGCMPSSAVSDGIQAKILEDYPDANFLAIETTGDSPVLFYSRIQMALYKAKKRADTEVRLLLQKHSCSSQSAMNMLASNSKVNDYRYYPTAQAAGTTARLYEHLLRESFLER
ncbi:MAG TPA: hypothetical protein ENI98_09125 [Gammaproteobacteria bacterium]|nr:hypothetical protein [Gammaproteobacteria bacterium]